VGSGGEGATVVVVVVGCGTVVVVVVVVLVGAAVVVAAGAAAVVTGAAAATSISTAPTAAATTETGTRMRSSTHRCVLHASRTGTCRRIGAKPARNPDRLRRQASDGRDAVLAPGPVHLLGLGDLQALPDGEAGVGRIDHVVHVGVAGGDVRIDVLA